MKYAILILISLAIGYAVAPKTMSYSDVQNYRVECNKSCATKYGERGKKDKSMWLACTLGCNMFRCMER